MPIFEYKCSSCDELFETLVRSNSQPTCPGCGGTYLAKQLSVFAASTGGGGGDSGEGAAPSGGGHVCGGGCTLH
jgi:putative FmdB family regulatory protein